MTENETRVVTVRMPACLHETLIAEAHRRHVSLNKLCIAACELLLNQRPISYEPTEERNES